MVIDHCLLSIRSEPDKPAGFWVMVIDHCLLSIRSELAGEINTRRTTPFHPLSPPFTPLRPPPKAASTPSRQKQIPSSDVINDW